MVGEVLFGVLVGSLPRPGDHLPKPAFSLLTPPLPQVLPLGWGCRPWFWISLLDSLFFTPPIPVCLPAADLHECHSDPVFPLLRTFLWRACRGVNPGSISQN